MLEFNKISKSFKSDFWGKGTKVLDEVSFKISAGDIIGFLGANGAGKTTSLKILMDFIKHDSGEVIFADSLGNKRVEINKSIGYLPEHPYFYPDLTGMDFINFLLELNDVSPNSVSDQISLWTERLKIDHALNRKIRGYSKGMLQRLGFVAAILHKPKFLILDEPLSGVDPVGRTILKEAMRDLNKNGTTIFFSSHIVADLEEVCNKVIFLEKGKVLFSGEKDELLRANSSGNYKVTYLENGKLKIREIIQSEKNDFLKHIIDNGGELIALQQIIPTLEEVVYKLKK